MSNTKNNGNSVANVANLPEDMLLHQPVRPIRTVLAEAMSFLTNALTSRVEWLRSMFDRRRSIDDECGYPTNPGAEEYYKLYSRDPIARRANGLFSKECWQVNPLIYESEDEDVETPFEAALKELPKQLRGEFSWFVGDEGNPLYEYCARVDRLAGIGHYGVLYLGFDGNEDPSRPLVGKPGPTATRRLLMVRAFPELLAKIDSYDTDKRSPRFGMPTTYTLHLHNPQAVSAVGMSSNETTIKVHYTRIIHVVLDEIESNETHHTPRLQVPFNRLMDCNKVYGSSAEMFYKGAFPGLIVETPPEFGNKILYDEEKMKDKIEEYANGLQRWLLALGAQVKSLAPQAVDPTPWIERLLEAVCIYLDAPKRKFMGSEVGELASSQDDESFDDKVKRRCNTMLTPRLLVPLTDRLIWAGCLPIPGEGYKVFWPDANTQTDQDKATVLATRTAALAQYKQSGADTIMAPVDYFTKWVGWSREEAEAVLENAMEHTLEQQELDAEKEEERMTREQQFSQDNAEFQAELDSKAVLPPV